MTSFRTYLRRQHVGLLALLLILSGGVSYAAGALPKNSVKSAQIKNNAVKGKDLKDSTITGADVGDGKLTGADVGDGKLTFGVTCSPNYSVNSFAAAGLSPARAGSYGLEQFHAPGEAVDAAPLVGSATVSRLNDTGMPTGGAGFGGSSFGFGQVVLFAQTSTKDVYADITISYCSARAVVSIDNKPAGSVLTSTSGKPGRQHTVCTASGAATCEKDS